MWRSLHGFCPIGHTYVQPYCIQLTTVSISPKFLYIILGRGLMLRACEKEEEKKGKGGIKIHSQFNHFHQEAVTTFS